ncbi:hypothetical protein TURU_054728 [Turdus rufiventris]|nr:hypothetical protein TURU_054728 [Turdus rufiventris]
MNAAREHQCQAGIVPAFTSLTGTDRDKGSRPAPGLCCPQGRKGPAGDLAGHMELLSATAPEKAGKDATASQAEVEGAEKAMPEGESLVGTGLGGKVVAPEGAAAIVVGASENPAAERVAEAFARAAERIAVSEVSKVLQSAIAELKGKRKNMWIKPRNTTQQEEDWMKEGEIFKTSGSEDRTDRNTCAPRRTEKKFCLSRSGGRGEAAWEVKRGQKASTVPGNNLSLHISSCSAFDVVNASAVMREEEKKTILHFAEHQQCKQKYKVSAMPGSQRGRGEVSVQWKGSMKLFLPIGASSSATDILAGQNQSWQAERWKRTGSFPTGHLEVMAVV